MNYLIFDLIYLLEKKHVTNITIADNGEAIFDLIYLLEKKHVTNITIADNGEALFQKNNILSLYFFHCPVLVNIIILSLQMLHMYLCNIQPFYQ